MKRLVVMLFLCSFVFCVNAADKYSGTIQQLANKCREANENGTDEEKNEAAKACYRAGLLSEFTGQYKEARRFYDRGFLQLEDYYYNAQRLIGLYHTRYKELGISKREGLKRVGIYSAMVCYEVGGSACLILSTPGFTEAAGIVHDEAFIMELLAKGCISGDKPCCDELNNRLEKAK